MDITILGIESSCHDTSAAVIRNNLLLSNVIASQAVHIKYGGVIPELASRAHQQNIIPVVDTALREAGLTVGEIDAIAFTRGPGAAGFAARRGIVRQGALGGARHPDGRGQPPAGAYPLAFHRPGRPRTAPSRLPVPLPAGQRRAYADRTRGFAARYGRSSARPIDDAAGEAFEQMRQSMGLPYPGGPVLSTAWQRRATPRRSAWHIPMSTATTIRSRGQDLVPLHAARRRGRRPRFHRAQQGRPLRVASGDDRGDTARQTGAGVERQGIRDIAIAGAYRPTRNRERIVEQGLKRGWRTFLPEFKFTTDNTASSPWQATTTTSTATSRRSTCRPWHGSTSCNAAGKMKRQRPSCCSWRGSAVHTPATAMRSGFAHGAPGKRSRKKRWRNTASTAVSPVGDRRRTPRAHVRQILSRTAPAPARSSATCAGCTATSQAKPCWANWSATRP